MSDGYNKEELYRNRLVTLYTEANPNPHSMKFMLNFMIVPEGENFDYSSVDNAGESPLAEALFGLDSAVERVFFMNNFVTVTKAADADWNALIAKIKPFIKQWFEEQKAVFAEEPKSINEIGENDTEAIKKIKGVLDEYIKPAVEMDGGAIKFDSFDEVSGVLKVELQGSCSGCPSSTVTLKSGIENLMKRMVPSVREVVA